MTTATTPPTAAPATRRRLPGSASMVPVVAPLVLLLLVAALGPLLAPYSPIDVVAAPDQPPSTQHWFGTDIYGLDVFSRVIAATRNDLVVGLVAALLATVIGVGVGLFTGTNESRGGVPGSVARGVTRGLDLFDALPQIVVGLVLLAFFGRNLLTLSVVCGLLMVPTQARVVRTEVLRVRREAYLESARLSGESERGLLLRHMLPNSTWPALENASYIFGVAVTVAAGLGFLGVGLPPPTPEWGAMIADGATAASAGRWWSSLFPCLALAVTVIAFSNLAHQYLRRR
ncbi:ABC transporter permease [Occultella glacieicola]|uniref:ABC transporter permease n=1 Tax=Occultella glacieicola TaxID=2518684 RepID=A0ABY2DZR0_9MICO|nr:ABC transporter permease [Occultella glacieicola]TDE89573.1 ABC transporter permease [Occultella glacieicola]